MKNSLLYGAMLGLICTQVHADPATTVKPATSNQGTPSAAVVPTPKKSKVFETPLITPVQPVTITSGQKTTVQPNPVQPVATTVEPSATTVPQVPQMMSCDYKIPADTKAVDQAIVLNWSEKATLQAFDFDATGLDVQLLKLQSCFTEQGWTGFNSALQKSGNLDAIKNQKLKVTSHLDGKAQVTEAKDNQWKVTLPLQVLYQNDKEKVTQLLNVNLTIGRKTTGDLGIIQIIATPRPATSNAAQTPVGQVTASAPTKSTVPTNSNDSSDTPSNNTDTTNAPTTANDSNANTKASSNGSESQQSDNNTDTNE